MNKSGRDNKSQTSKIWQKEFRFFDMDFYKEWQNIRKEKELNNCISTEFKLNVCFKPKNSDIYKFLEDDILFLPQSILKTSVQIKKNFTILHLKALGTPTSNSNPGLKEGLNSRN